MSQVYLHQQELADRWRISPRTLERWRWRKSGPSYHKIGGRVVYRLEDIVDFERDQLQHTMDTQPRAGAV